MNWTMVCSVAICVPILIPYKQRFARRELDKDAGRQSLIYYFRIIDMGPLGGHTSLCFVVSIQSSLAKRKPLDI